MLNQLRYGPGQSRYHPRTVWFTGSTAIKKGQGLAYDRDTGTAGSQDQKRDWYVEVLSATNNRNFAGVAARNYDAETGGQEIEIFEPGSICEVLVGAVGTINSTRLTCAAGSGGDKGWFTRPGFPGRGTCTLLETVSTERIANSTLDGTGSIATTGILTKTGAFAGAAFIAAVAAGNAYVIVLDGAEADGSQPVDVRGVYAVSSITTTDNAVQLVGVPAPADATLCSFIAVIGYPTALAYLEDGPESGCQEWLQTKDNVACQDMVGGYTYVGGGWTLGAGNATATLADGYPGLKKGYQCKGALTTNDFAVTVTSGERPVLNAPTSFETSTTGVYTTSSHAARNMPLNSLLFDAANEEAVLEWNGVTPTTGAWMLKWDSAAGIVT